MTIKKYSLKDFELFEDSVKKRMINSDFCLKVKYTDPKFPTLHITEQGDWIDIKTAEDYSLKQGEFALINLGIAMKLPKHYEAWLAPRSSTFKKYGLIQTNSIGIIDNSYSGNNDIWKLPVYATRDTVVDKGERLCQFRLIENMSSIFSKTYFNNNIFGDNRYPLIIIEVDQLEDADRGGFGSTGR